MQDLLSKVLIQLALSYVSDLDLLVLLDLVLDLSLVLLYHALNLFQRNILHVQNWSKVLLLDVIGRLPLMS